MEDRFCRNAWSQEDWRRLKESHVCVVGCGGLGGRVAELLTRAGVGRLTLVDGDVFEASNLNRQCFATEDTLGQQKVLAVAVGCRRIDSDIDILTVPQMLDEENAPRLLRGVDLAVDGLDNVPARKLLAGVCAQADIPLIHGAVSGWQGQVAAIFPGEETLDRLYPGEGYAPDSSGQESTPFAPAFVAALQAAETVRILLGRGAALSGRLLVADLLEQEYRSFEI